MHLGSNATVEEIANYTPEQLAPEHVQILLDRIAELAPEHVQILLDRIAEQEEALSDAKAPRCDHDHGGHDEYRQFFDDVVQAFQESHGLWPAAEVWDNNLRQAIIEVIEA